MTAGNRVRRHTTVAVRRSLRAVPEPVSPAFYEALTDDARELLAEWASLRTYPAGAALFRKREPSDSVVVVLQGRVKLVNVTGRREVLLEIFGPGEIVSEVSWLQAAPHSATAIAVERVEALVMAATSFTAFLAERPDAAILLVRILSRRLAESERKRVQFATQDTLGRLAILLSDLAIRFGTSTPHGTRIDVPLSQEELAGCIGASHKAATSALQTLRGLQLIETGRRSITVLNIEALRERFG